MGTYRGNDGVFKLDTDLVGEVRSWTLTITGETVDDSAMGDTWRTRKHNGKKDWNGSLEGLLDMDDTGQAQLQVGDEVTVNLYHEGESTGNNYFSGSAFITSKSPSADHEGLVEVSFAFEGNGALTEGTVA